jgi:hypothetical protein
MRLRRGMRSKASCGRCDVRRGRGHMRRGRGEVRSRRHVRSGCCHMWSRRSDVRSRRHMRGGRSHVRSGHRGMRRATRSLLCLSLDAETGCDRQKRCCCDWIQMALHVENSALRQKRKTWRPSLLFPATKQRLVATWFSLASAESPFGVPSDQVLLWQDATAIVARIKFRRCSRTDRCRDRWSQLCGGDQKQSRGKKS